MEDFDRPGVALDQPAKTRSSGSRFGDLGERLTRAFSTSDRTAPRGQVNGGAAYPPEEGQVPYLDPVAPRFAITRQGYDCAAVDGHIDELERELSELDQELADLREARSSRSEVAAEIERIGKQTSSILLAAHEQAQETTRLAQEQADRCIADAASNALAMTEQATNQLRQMEAEKTSLSRERSRLVADIHNTAKDLFALAEDAAQRFQEPTQAIPEAP